MAKVGVKLGFTFRVGPLDTNQYARMDMEIHDIDTELPIEEQLEEAVMASIQQQAVQGALPIVYIAKIEKFRKKGFDIFEAVEKADEEIRKEQAAMAPPPEEGQVMSPEEAMGLAGPPQALPPEAMAETGATQQQGSPQAAMAQMQQALMAGG